jgi:hypothetical protein
VTTASEPATSGSATVDAADLLAAHAHKYTHWSRKDAPAVSVCICKAETPLDLPEDLMHVPEAEMTKADRAAHGKHLAEVIAANGYDRLGEWEIVVPKPNIPHKGPNHQESHFMRTAASNIEKGYPVGGSHVTYAVIKLLRDAANSLDAAAPAADS